MRAKVLLLFSILCLTILFGCTQNNGTKIDGDTSALNNNSFLKEKITNTWEISDYTLIEITDGYDHLYYLEGENDGQHELIGGAAYDLEYAKYENNKIYFIAHRVNEGSIIAFPYYMSYDLVTKKVESINLNLTTNDIGYWGQFLSTSVALQEVTLDQEGNLKFVFYPIDKSSMDYGTNPLRFFPFTKSFYDDEKKELVFAMYYTTIDSDLKAVGNDDSNLVTGIRLKIMENRQDDDFDNLWWLRGFNLSGDNEFSVTEARIKLEKPAKYRLKENYIQSSIAQEDKLGFTIILEPDYDL